MKMKITHQNDRSVSVIPNGNVPNTERALPRWIAMSTLCLKDADHWSWVATNKRLPRASIKSVASGTQTPIVATATGIKR